MNFFDLLIAPPTLAEVRAKMIAYLQAAAYPITNWIVGGAAQQDLEATASTIYIYAQQSARTARGYSSIDNAYDPGDVDPLYPDNANLPPEPGYLSNVGANWYDTDREGATYATCVMTLTNPSVGGTTQTFLPSGVTYTWTVSPPPVAPTYRGVDQATYDVVGGGTITAAIDGTIVLPVGVAVYMPIVAEQAGSASNAPASTITLTTVLGLCSATNAASAIGRDREDRDAYIARCKLAPQRNSLGGPPGEIEYYATTNTDGSPLLNASGNPVNITKVYVSTNSGTGVVNAYYANEGGGAAVLTEDVTAANENINLNTYVTPDVITFGPLSSTVGDVAIGGPGGTKAEDVSIAVEGTYKYRKVAGVDPADIPARIVAAIEAFSQSPEDNPIGGKGQVLGAGFVYAADIQAAAATATTASGGTLGIYDVLVTVPASDTAIPLGSVGVITSSAGDWTVP